ncbi:hypothetical protein BGZ95_005179 [Linnemannia exigua]|uniref:Uncharacterized protein n=1 Tax=Linnemannia exigua TaxID=604196 RepID=A0AAD4H1E6_9FUNG|nr:hypothetical protein BGZ95_005179 [Linnemannia exigua]
MNSTASYTETLPTRPRAKLHFDLATPASLDHGHDHVDRNSDLEDMMPNSPVSILHRKRKDSQEEHISALNLFDRQRGQHDAECAALPSLQGYGKGAKGRRPTVTFDLDDEPSSSQHEQHTGPLSVAHPHHRRHNDVDIDDALQATDDRVDLSLGVDSDKTQQQQAALGPDVPDSLLAAELRRVSITPPTELLPAASDSLSATRSTATTTTSASTTTTTATSATTLTTTAAASKTSSAVTEDSAQVAQPQEIHLHHIITAETVPQDMLVALFDRSSELEALVAIHSDFFNLIYSSLSKSACEHFKTLLFTPRSALGDRDWMQAIDQHLTALPPCILEKFKAIVGWIGPEGDENDDYLWGEDEYGYRDSSFEHIQIKWLRDVPDFPLETFKQCYPQFFVNARERLQGRRMSCGGDQRDQYLVFCETLDMSRDDLPCDNAWARRLNGCLESHPELLLQLKEIIAYETGYDD